MSTKSAGGIEDSGEVGDPSTASSTLAHSRSAGAGVVTARPTTTAACAAFQCGHVGARSFHEPTARNAATAASSMDGTLARRLCGRRRQGVDMMMDDSVDAVDAMNIDDTVVDGWCHLLL